MTAKLRLEPSREGFVWIGGRKIGQLCKRAWNGEVSRNGELRVAADLAILIDRLCSTLECLHRGRFDRRYRSCVANWAGLTELYRKRVFEGRS